MIIKIHGRRYRLSPGLTAFVRGMQSGAGWALAFSLVMFFMAMVIAAAWRYAIFH